MDARHNQLSKSDALTDRLFEALIRNSFDVFEIVDENAICTYVSPSVERVLGFTPEEFVGRSVFDFVHPDQLEWARSVHKQILDGDFPQPILVTCRHKDGSWREVECVVQNRVDDPAIAGIVVNLRDISEHKRWERALKESEERYQNAFRSSPDGIALSRLRDGVFIDVNESFEHITGHTREEMVGASTLSLKHWRNPTDRERLATLVREKGCVRNFEATFVGKDGREHIGLLSADVLDLGGEPCLLTTARDVTGEVAAHKRLEQATIQLHEEHKNLLEKNATLARMLNDLQQDKNSYRHEVTARVENLFRPLLRKLATGYGRLAAADLRLMDHRLEIIGGNEVDAFQDNLEKLSPRERDVCDLIRRGLGSAEIARELRLSPETVNKHRQSIRRKLQIDHRGINLSSYLRSR